MVAPIVYIACVVIVPVLLNVFCLIMLVRAACVRLRGRNEPEQASQLESPTDVKCAEQPAVQGLTHFIVLHPDHQIVCGRVLKQQLFGHENRNKKTDSGLTQTALHSNDGGAFTLWVASVPPAHIDGQAPLNSTEDVLTDGKENNQT